MTDERRANPAGRAAGGLLVAAFLLGLTAFQVRQGEIAVVTTFGKPTRTVSAPGLNWKLPWPVQKVYRFDGRLQSLQGAMEQTFTKDGRYLMVELFAAWRVADAPRFLERLGSPEMAETPLRNLLSTHSGAVFGGHDFAELVATDPAKLQFDTVEQALLDAVQPEAERYGMAVELVGIRRLGLPQDLTDDVFARQRAERLRVAAATRADGQQRAATIASDADRDAAKLRADGEAKATLIEGEADREAVKYYRELGRHPDLANFDQEARALQDIVGDGKTSLVLGADGPALRLLNGDGVPGGGAGR